MNECMHVNEQQANTADMLDEIVEYVKLLQQKIKVNFAWNQTTSI